MKQFYWLILLLFIFDSWGVEISYFNGDVIIQVDDQHAFVVRPVDLYIKKVDLVFYFGNYISCGDRFFYFTALTGIQVRLFEIKYRTGEVFLGWFDETTSSE